MPSPLFAALTLAAACTGPYCGPDTPFEQPTRGILGEAAAPVLASDGKGVFVVWEHRVLGEPDILFTRREAREGGAWDETPRRLDTDPPGAARSLEPRIATGVPGTLHVVWQDGRDGSDGIRTNRSTDGGRQWLEADVLLDDAPAGASISSMPGIAADRAGWVGVVWESQRDGERDIRFRRSVDRGESWEPARRLDSDAAGSGVSYHPQIVAWEGGDVAVVWWDERDGRADVYLRRSRDGGATWPEAERRLDPGAPGEETSRDVRLAVDGDRLALTWEEGTKGAGGRIVARQSTDRGATWGELRTLGYGDDPSPLVGAGGPLGAWTQSAPAAGHAMTSIGGRLVEIVPAIGLWVASEEDRGGQRLSEADGPASVWAGGSGDVPATSLWVVRTGSSVGRGVVEIFRGASEAGGGPGAAPVRWRRTRTVLFGESLQSTAVPVIALGPAGVVSDEALHVVWVARTGESDDLGYLRVK